MANSLGPFSSLFQSAFGGPGINQSAPTVNTAGTQQWLNQSGTNANFNNALNMQANTAAGKGPSAASDLLKANAQQTMANTNALANSGTGNVGAGATRRQAMLQGAGQLQNLGAQAAAQRSAEQLAAENMYGNLAATQRGQDIQSANVTAQQADTQAQLASQQQIANMQAASQQAQGGSNMFSGLVGAAAQAAPLLMMSDERSKEPVNEGHFNVRQPATFGDAQFQEPGKPEVAFTLREEPYGLFGLNRYTGEYGKVPLVPLTPEEHRQTFDRPHGAGGLDSPDRKRTVMHDGDVGGNPYNVKMGPASFPQQDGDPRQEDSYGSPVMGYHNNPSKFHPQGGLNDHDRWRISQGMAPESRSAFPGYGAGSAMKGDESIDDYMARNSGSSPTGDQPSFYGTSDPNQLRAQEDSQMNRMVPTGAESGNSDDLFKQFQKANESSIPKWEPPDGVKSSEDDPDADTYANRLNKFYDSPLGKAYGNFAGAMGHISTGNQESPRITGELYHDADFFKRGNSYPPPGRELEITGSINSDAEKKSGSSAPFFRDTDPGNYYHVNEQSGASDAIWSDFDSKIPSSGSTYADGDVQMGPVTVTQGREPVSVEREDDQSPVTKTSPVASQEKSGAHGEFLDPFRAFYSHPDPDKTADYTTFAESKLPSGTGPYSSLPQGPEIDLRDFGDLSVADRRTSGIHQLPNPETETAEIKHRAGGADVKSVPVQDQTPPVDWSRVLSPKAMAHSTYMDGDIVSDENAKQEVARQAYTMGLQHGAERFSRSDMQGADPILPMAGKPDDFWVRGKDMGYVPYSSLPPAPGADLPPPPDQSEMPPQEADAAPRVSSSSSMRHEKFKPAPPPPQPLPQQADIVSDAHRKEDPSHFGDEQGLPRRPVSEVGPEQAHSSAVAAVHADGDVVAGPGGPQPAHNSNEGATKPHVGNLPDQDAVQGATPNDDQHGAGHFQTNPHPNSGHVIPGPISGGFGPPHEAGEDARKPRDWELNGDGSAVYGSDPGVSGIISDEDKKISMDKDKKLGENVKRLGKKDDEANQGKGTSNTGDAGGKEQAEAKIGDKESSRREHNSQHVPSKKDESSYGVSPKKTERTDPYGAKNPQGDGKAWYEDYFKRQDNGPPESNGQSWGHPGMSNTIHAADMDVGMHGMDAIRNWSPMASHQAAFEAGMRAGLSAASPQAQMQRQLPEQAPHDYRSAPPPRPGAQHDPMTDWRGESMTRPDGNPPSKMGLAAASGDRVGSAGLRYLMNKRSGY